MAEPTPRAPRVPFWNAKTAGIIGGAVLLIIALAGRPMPPAAEAEQPSHEPAPAGQNAAGSNQIRLMSVKVLAALAVYDKYCGGLPATGLDRFNKIAPMVSKLELDEEFPKAVERMRGVGKEEFCVFMKRGW